MNMIMDKMFSIAIVGSAGVGKTTYLNRLAGGAFSAPWNQTTGRVDRSIMFNTNYGPISLTFNDYSGADTYDGSGIKADVDGVIYMYDVTNRTSLKNINKVYSTLFSDIPYVTLANKIDIDPRDHKVYSAPADVEEISTKRGTNLLNPIQNLLKKVSGLEDMTIIS